MLNPKLKELTQYMEKMGHLSGIMSLLHWDQSTQMPEGALESRAKQMSILSEIIHQHKTSPQFEKILEKFIDIESGENKLLDASEYDRKFIFEIYKDYMRGKCLPDSFVKEFQELITHAEYHWSCARKENDFKKFAPFLEKIVGMVKERASYLKENLFPKDYTLYDCLLDEYSPGTTTKEISSIFKILKQGTDEILSTKSMTPIPLPWKGHSFDINSQIQFNKKMAKLLGLNESNSRLDLSTHPFCTHFHPTDVRITTRFKEDDFTDGLFSTIHESGHALYELNQKHEYFGTPFGEAMSMSVHESQSRFFEIMVAKERAFWKPHFPELKRLYADQLQDVTLDQLIQFITRIEKGFIRVDSDELTYNLHIMFRYDLEKELIDGNLKVIDLPQAWNLKCKEYLGITPRNDSEGVLQDIHWAGGAFGYFPSYTLGNIYAAQLWNAFKKFQPQWEELLLSQNYSPIINWLKENIHTKGKTTIEKDLIKMITGKDPGPEDYLSKFK